MFSNVGAMSGKVWVPGRQPEASFVKTDTLFVQMSVFTKLGKFN